jgi:hypothetical protein
MSKGKWIPMNADGTMNCTDCGEAKPYTNEYFPYQIKKEGKLLKRCKPCQLIRTKKHYRDNPKYFVEYREENWLSGMKEYTKQWMKENNSAKYNCKIYSITNPIGEKYIGLTQYKSIEWRFMFHRKTYKEGKYAQRKLHLSFDKWGIENHTLEMVEELDTTDRAIGRATESKWIKHFKELKKSLNISK